jgi:hypothetical protein
MKNEIKGLSPEKTLDLTCRLKDLETHDTASVEYKTGLAKLILEIYQENSGDSGIVALFGYLARLPEQRTIMEKQASMMLLMIPSEATTPKICLGAFYLINQLKPLKEIGYQILNQLLDELNLLVLE